MRRWCFHIWNKRDVNVTRSLKNNGFSFEFPQSLWKTELFVISKCKDLIYLIFLTHFTDCSFFGWRVCKFWNVFSPSVTKASNGTLEPEWLPLFFPYFQTLIILTRWYVRNLLVSAIQRCLKFSFTPGHYYLMTLWAFGFEAIGVI